MRAFFAPGFDSPQLHKSMITSSLNQSFWKSGRASYSYIYFGCGCGSGSGIGGLTPIRGITIIAVATVHNMPLNTVRSSIRSPEILSVSKISRTVRNVARTVVIITPNVHASLTSRSGGGGGNGGRIPIDIICEFWVKLISSDSMYITRYRKIFGTD